MNRALAMAAAAAICAAASAAFFAGAIPHKHPFVAVASEAGATVYYQDPDGKPLYSLTPRKTPDGRDWRGVPANADISFDEPTVPSVGKEAAEAKPERKIKYYRNPMGLPDTSPVPKKDSMGMDYIAVYEGEDTDDGSVKLSPGKIQRTGVESEPVARRPIRISRSGRRAPSRRTSGASRWSRCASRASSRRSPTSPPARTSTRASR